MEHTHPGSLPRFLVSQSPAAPSTPLKSTRVSDLKIEPLAPTPAGNPPVGPKTRRRSRCLAAGARAHEVESDSTTLMLDVALVHRHFAGTVDSRGLGTRGGRVCGIGRPLEGGYMGVMPCHGGGTKRIAEITHVGGLWDLRSVCWPVDVFQKQPPVGPQWFHTPYEFG